MRDLQIRYRMVESFFEADIVSNISYQLSRISITGWNGVLLYSLVSFFAGGYV